MFKISYEEIISRIQEEKGLGKAEIEEKIKVKIKQLSNLISKDGAAHIIANQLGIKLGEVPSNKVLKVDEIPSGVSSVNVSGKILSIYGVREFNKNGRQGKVANFLIGDETGTTRIVVWDENIIKEIEKGIVKQDEVVSIKNGYSKENNGAVEIHLGNKAQLIRNPDDVEIKEVKYKAIGTKRKDIESLKEQDYAQIYGTIVQVFEPRYYNICPECGKKVNYEDTGFRCAEHGVVQGKEVPVVNFFLDDGTSSIRAVAFNEQAFALLGEKRESFEELRLDVLGKQVIITGKVNKSNMYDRLELVVREVKEADPKELFMER